MSRRKNETHEEYLARRRILRRAPDYLKKAREQSRKYRLNNPEKVRVRNRRNYLKFPGARGRLKRTYGITPEQYDELFAEQAGLCAACEQRPREGRPLCVDHCHKTKQVRGLLCDACNVCAGHLESQRFAQVRDYLARQRRPNWTVWGNETEKFKPDYDAQADFAGSLEVGYQAIRERVAAGGPGWQQNKDGENV